jgi:hypothetical protein
VIDSGASSHITANPGMVTASPSSVFPSSIIVGNGATLPVIGTGYSVLPGPFRLDNVLIAPDIIRNLLSVRKFTTDNLVSVEFDPLGVSVKDLRTRNTLLRCDSTGPLYTLQLPSSTAGLCALVATPSLSRASKNFDLIHCDLWTSPTISVSGFKYYLVILDDCSHFLWTFPLRVKFDAFSTIAHFFAHVSTQYGCTVKSV